MSRSMKEIALLAFACVALFVGLTHLDAVFGFLLMLVGLAQPVLIGGILAFFLNVPMTGQDLLANQRWTVRTISSAFGL